LAKLQQEQKERIEASSLKETAKQSLKKLTEELAKAENLSQLEKTKQAIEEELTPLSREGIKKDEIEKSNEMFNELAKVKKTFIIEKNLSSLKEKVEDLKKVTPREAEKLQEHLKKISKSSSNEDLEKNINAIKEYSSSQGEKSGQIFKEAEEYVSLQIYILPSYLVIPVGSSVTLKAIAVYNKKFIKELRSELEWFSSQPYVASVDKEGVVSALSKGKTQISANYKGKDSEKVEVIVADKIDEQIDRTVREELER
jgi:uncharacterized protein YjdB